ncbi:hypothetical protein V6767_02005 [Martelella sp. FLE1502]
MTGPSDPYAHSVTAVIEVPAAFAFSFMADPIALGRWSLGCMNTRPTGDREIHAGTSLFDGSESHFAIDADLARLIVDYHVGEPGQLLPRISARVIKPEICGLPESYCALTLSAWRARDMDAARWHRLCATHETEILLIKAQCEAAYLRGKSKEDSKAASL